MSKEETLNKENSKRKFSDWFWDITTRWYFFPVFYVMLALILSVSIQNFLNVLGTYLGTSYKEKIFSLLVSMFLLLLPGGIIYYYPNYLLHLLTFSYAAYILNPGWLIPILSVAVIQYYKIKKKSVIKWLVLSLLLYFLSSFLITELYFSLSLPDYFYQ